MELLQKLEAKLADINKGLPQLPSNWKNWLAKYAWVFALIGGIFGVISALALITGVLFVTAVVDTYSIYTAVPEAHHYLALAWIALAVMVAYVVVLLVSVPKLKAMQKSGWNLSFYSAVFFFFYDIFNWLQYPGAVGNLIGALIGTALGLYVLFQIRDHFTARHSVATSKK